MAKIRLVGGRECDAFVSLDGEPVSVPHVRPALGALLRELQRRWPVESVRIEVRPVWRANPLNPAEIVAHPSNGIAIDFKSVFVPTLGQKASVSMADAVTAQIRTWLRTGRKTKGNLKYAIASRAER